jgi:5-methylcytosine-specific restriction endonuclease McrA
VVTRNSERDRKICLDAHSFDWNGSKHVKCHVCALPLNVATREWHADHIARHAEGGESTAQNLWPICVPCHRAKSAKDTSEIAKGKRVAKRHFGVKRSKGFRKPAGAKFDWSQGRYVRGEE